MTHKCNIVNHHVCLCFKTELLKREMVEGHATLLLWIRTQIKLCKKTIIDITTKCKVNPHT